MAKKPQYNNDSIVALKDEQRVRQKPAVIFGSDGIDGCEHAVFEIVSNSVDEAREGYGDKVIVTRFADKSVEVQDFGRGLTIPKSVTIGSLFFASFMQAESTIMPRAEATNFPWVRTVSVCVRRSMLPNTWKRKSTRADLSIPLISRMADPTVKCRRSRIQSVIRERV